MAKDLQFIDGLGLNLVVKAEENIGLNLIREFYEQIEEDDHLLGDRKFACMSDLKEVRDAFNKFYNLTPTDEEYLD
jgi:hypothetical protein